MKCVITPFFLSQIQNIKRKYRKVEDDLSDFCEHLESETAKSELSYQIWKYRMKNSSIPTGKRGGFRIIAKEYQNTLYPFLIYSKTIRENVSAHEIEEAYEKLILSLSPSDE